MGVATTGGTVETDVDPVMPFNLKANTMSLFYLITEGKLGDSSFEGQLISDECSLALIAQSAPDGQPSGLVYGGPIQEGNSATLKFTVATSS